MSNFRSYQDLIVWKKSITFVKLIYRLTDEFPKSELFGLASQIRRAAVSIPSNIAEGRSRKGDKEFIRFLYIAYGSGAELETQLIIAKELLFFKDFQLFNEIDCLLTEIMKMLNKLISSTNYQNKE